MSDNITMPDAINDLRARVEELEKERQGGDVEWIDAKISECAETFRGVRVRWNSVPLLRARLRPTDLPPPSPVFETGVVDWENYKYLLVTFDQEMVIVRSKDISGLKPCVDSPWWDDRRWRRLLFTNRPYLLMGRTRKNELLFQRDVWPVSKTMNLLVDGMEPVKT